MTVYINGPITGIPDGNRQAFLLAAVILRECGHDPVNLHQPRMPKAVGHD